MERFKICVHWLLVALEESQQNQDYIDQLEEEQQKHPDRVLWTYLQREEEKYKEEREEKEKHRFDVRISTDTEIWIRKEIDVDGYFFLQIGDDEKHMFLTAEDAYSLTVERK